MSSSLGDVKCFPNATPPLVSVIIPTVGRMSLAAAVRSALHQTWRNIEVIVSVDGPIDQLDGVVLPRNRRLRVIASQHRLGAQIARGRGIGESSGDFVALLDDDDYWFPEKIEKQIAIATEELAHGALHVVIGCKMQLVDQDSLLIDVIPKRLPSSDEDIADYIFKRNRVFPGGTVAGSSMLLFDRALADIVPFDVHLPIHDDWDWLLNVQESTGTRMSFSSEVLMQYTRNPIGTSLSSSSRAAESAKWFQGRKSALSPQQFGDGLLCYSVPLALQQHQWREAFRLLKSSLCSGRPGIRSFIFVTLIFLKEVLLLNAAGTLIVTKFTQNRLKVVMPDLPS